MRSSAIIVVCVALAGGVARGQYVQTNLVSNGAATASFVDPNLINPWGIAIQPGGPFWIANQGTSTATAYNTLGQPTSPAITIPQPGGLGYEHGTTGILYSSSSAFQITSGGKTAASRYVFAGLDGGISGWSPDVDPANAILAVNNLFSASYTGITKAARGRAEFLYAANALTGTIDVFDSAFQPFAVPGGFADPNLGGLVPFNIENIGNDLYVMYEQPENGTVATSKEKGVVNVFDPNGNLLRRFATGGPLDAPWGIALAPADFGKFSNALLIGNDGNGTINAFDPTTGAFLGELKDAKGNALANEELWGLAFGTGGDGGKTNTLYFAAGINGEQGGLFGAISAASGGGNGGTAVPLPPAFYAAPMAMAIAFFAMKKFHATK